MDKLASLTPYNASPAAKGRGLLTKAGVTEGVDITIQVRSHSFIVYIY